MISTQEALQIILNNTQDFGVEEIPFFKRNRTRIKRRYQSR